MKHWCTKNPASRKCCILHRHQLWICTTNQLLFPLFDSPRKTFYIGRIDLQCRQYSSAYKGSTKMPRKSLLLCAICVAFILAVSGTPVVGTTGASLLIDKKRTSKKQSTLVVATSNNGKKANKMRDVKVIAQSGPLSKILSRLPFRRAAPAIVKVLGPPPSSLTKINILMFMFYTTLGAAMPFIPLYYKHIGISSTCVSVPDSSS